MLEATASGASPGAQIDLAAVFADSQVSEVLDQLDRELVGLAPVKARIRDIAALLLIDRARASLGLDNASPSLHMSFTGNPGTGKTTVAMRMAEILHRLGYVRKGHLVAVTRDDLVGQYIGHTAPKTKEVLKKAMGGVLLIDEAYYLYRPENERDYGQEAIEILLQTMENQRDDLVVIFAGYKERMEIFFRSNPGLSSRIAHHIDFPDYAVEELQQIAERMLERMQYRLSVSARAALAEYIPLRMAQPHFANARSIRNALDRARLRQASRLFGNKQGAVTREQLMTIEAEDLLASRVFSQAAVAVKQEPGAGHVMARELTLTEFIIREQRRFPRATGEFTALLNYVRLACKRISYMIGRGALGDVLGSAGVTNVQGETQAKLDVIANDIFISTSESGGHLAAMVSEEMEMPYAIPSEFPRGKYLLVFDPLDGSSNIDVNVSVGSIFSVLQRPLTEGEATVAEFLQAGTRQLCAGYAIYGPTTMLVLTVGRGVHGFTLDRGFGEFILTHPELRVPEETSEFAINASNERFWEPPVKRYVAECLAGRGGPRGKDFNMRWIASLVAEVHRILVRGGLFMYPRDTRDSGREGRLRLLYEANPMAMILEQAGGAGSTGRGRMLDVVPAELHQRVPVVLGSKREVERVERYHLEHEQGLDLPFTSPLFNERSLFTQL